MQKDDFMMFILTFALVCYKNVYSHYSKSPTCFGIFFFWLSSRIYL